MDPIADTLAVQSICYRGFADNAKVVELVKANGLNAIELCGVHVKDFVFDRAARPEDVVVGTGNLDLPAFQQKLTEVGFTGPAILEYEGDVDDPVPALTECVAAIRGIAG